MNCKRTVQALAALLLLIAGCAAPSTQAPTAIPTSAPTLTAIPTGTSTAVPEGTLTRPAQIGTDAATFLNETYPDYSAVAPGEKFVKTWEVKNDGTNTWNTSYSLVLDSTPQNEAFGSPVRVPFPQATPPGGIVPLSVSLTAPTNPGTYTVYWSLKNDRNETFGVDGGRVWVTVMVCAAGKTCSPPSSPSSGGSISANGISVTVNNFTYEAQSATVDFCMTVSLHKYTLTPAPSLLIDQKPAPFLSGGSNFASGPGCLEMKYQVGAAEIEQAQQITLFIDGSLRMTPPPGNPNVACQSSRLKLVAEYPGLDFQCAFSGAGYFTELQLPAGMDSTKAQQVITDEIEGAIYGPWILNIR